MKVDAVRRARLEQLRLCLQRGTYLVDTQQIALAILERSLERLRVAAN